MNSFPGWLKAVLAVVVLALLAGGFSFYRAQERRVRQDVESDLRSIAELKANQITSWRENHLAEGDELAASPFLVRGVARWFAEPPATAPEEILSRFRSLQKHYRYDDILLVDAEGRVRLSLRGKPEALEAGLTQAMSTALRNRTSFLTDLHTDKLDLSSHISIVAPLFAEEAKTEKPVGAVILISSARQFLYPLIQSWPVPGKTAETLLVRRDGNDVLFLNDLRHQTNSALKLRIPLSQTNVPAVMAVLGREGVVEGRDYRGAEVISALKHIPDSPWFMVAKVDAAEAFADWQFRSGLILALLLVLVALAGAVVFVVWQRNQKAHYRTLYRAEAAQLAGERRYGVTLKSIGDAVITTDIQGRVELLNPVAETLTGWRDEEARGKPLEEVFRIINEDTQQPAENPVARVMREGMVMGLANHTALIARDGTKRAIADSGAPIHNEKNEISGVVLVFREQTEELAMQKAVRDSERRFRAIFNSTFQFIGLLRPDGTVLEINQAALEFGGLKLDDIRGRFYWDTRWWSLSAEIQSQLKTAVAQAAAGQFVRYEVNVQGKDDRVMTIDFSLNPIKDETGQVVLLLPEGRDITERRRTETELHRRTRELAALNSLARGVSSSLSLETVVASALREMLNAVKTDITFLFLREGERLVLGGVAPESGRERLGQIPEHRVGECMCGLAVRQGQPLYSRDIFSDLRCTWEECKKAGFRSFAALPLRTGDEIIGVVGLASGTERDFEQQAEFLETLANAVSVSLQNARLFAETKRAEDEIRTILRTTMDGFYLVDKAGRFLDTNEAYCRMIGYSREELLKMAIKDIEAIDNDEVIKKRIQQIMDAGHVRFETKHRCKDGKVIIIEASVTALKDGEGKLVVFMRDITERKQAEEN